MDYSEMRHDVEQVLGEVHEQKKGDARPRSSISRTRRRSSLALMQKDGGVAPRVFAVSQQGRESGAHETSRRKASSSQRRRSSLAHMQKEESNAVLRILEVAHAYGQQSKEVKRSDRGIFVTGPPGADGAEQVSVNAAELERIGKEILQKRQEIRKGSTSKEARRRMSAEVDEMAAQRMKLIELARRQSDTTRPMALPKPSTVGFSFSKAARRRSSFDGLKDVACDLMVAGKKERSLDHGWRDVFYHVFPEERPSRRQVRLTSPLPQDGGGVHSRPHEDQEEDHCKDFAIQEFLQTSTPHEHQEFVLSALDPSRSTELRRVVKHIIMHYTGQGADDLILFAGGGGRSLALLLYTTLAVLREGHIDLVPCVMLMSWLFSRVPDTRALLLKEGVIRLSLQRLKAVGENRALHLSCLTLLAGTMW